MLTFEQIKELLELVSARGLGGLEIERAGFRLRIDAKAPAAVAAAPEAARAAALPLAQAIAASPAVAASVAAAAPPANAPAAAGVDEPIRIEG